MSSRLRMSLGVCLLLTISIVPAAHFLLAQSAQAQQDAGVPNAADEPARRTIPAVPAQASYAHRLRLHVINVTPIEQVDKTRILKLEVERFYGKIDKVSAERAQKHETSRFTILFPASVDANVTPGDIIDYGLIGYLPMGRE